MTLTIKEFLEKATEEQRKLIFQLNDLAREEKKYADETNRIQDSTKSGIYRDSLAVTVCEDEDDVMVISADARQKLNYVRRQMKQLYENAVKIGMRELGIIERHYKHYVGKPLPDN